MTRMSINQFARSVFGEARWHEVSEVLDGGKRCSAPLVSSFGGDVIRDGEIGGLQAGHTNYLAVPLSPIGGNDVVHGTVSKAEQPIQDRVSKLTINQLLKLRGVVVPAHESPPGLNERLNARIRASQIARAGASP